MQSTHALYNKLFGYPHAGVHEFPGRGVGVFFKDFKNIKSVLYKIKEDQKRKWGAIAHCWIKILVSIQATKVWLLNKTVKKNENSQNTLLLLFFFL